MTTKDEALKLAAERVLDAWDYPQGTKEMNRRMRELRAALVEPRATPDVPEVDFGNTSPQGSMSFYVGGKLAHTVGNPVMSFAVSHEPSAWAAAIDTSGQRVEEAADGGHEAAQQQEPASEEDMKVYKAIAANYRASLQPAQQQEPAGRTDQQIVDQTEALAVWLLSWGFNRQPETPTPMRESRHPMAVRCWAAACHIQEMLTATDPENAVAELDDATPVQQQESDGWTPIERAYPQSGAIDIMLADGSVLCEVLPQADGHLWWGGAGTGEKFIDPAFTSVAHWRAHKAGGAA